MIKIKTNFIIVSWLLCAFAVAESGRKSITQHPNFSNVERALSNFVEQRGSYERATLIVPNYREEGESVVIYWVEERALFDFPLEFSPEAVEHPLPLNRRFYRLTNEFFYSADSNNPAHHSSTFMTTWEWAKEKVFTAVKDGHILSIEDPSTELLVSITNIRGLREPNDSLRILYTVHHPETLAGTTFLVMVPSRDRDELRKENPPGSLHTLTVTSAFARTLREQSMAREKAQRQIDAGVDPTRISSLIPVPNLKEKDIQVGFETYKFN